MLRIGPLLLALVAADGPTQHLPTFSAESRMVDLTVAAEDRRGRYLPDLTVEDFSVYEDGIQRPVRHFAAEELHLDLVLVVDTSASMRNSLPAVRQATLLLLDTLKPDDHVEVLTFSSGVYRACPFTNDRQVIERALQFTTPENDGSHIFRALADSFRELRAHDIERDRRRAVILFSDGIDNDNLAADEEWLLREWSLSDAVVYLVLTRAPADVAMKFPDPRGIFRTVAEQSGGTVYPLSEPYGLRRAFASVAAELRSQYRIGYEPGNRPPGQWRTILVMARGASAVRHRLKYYDPKPR